MRCHGVVRSGFLPKQIPLLEEQPHQCAGDLLGAVVELLGEGLPLAVAAGRCCSASRAAMCAVACSCCAAG